MTNVRLRGIWIILSCVWCFASAQVLIRYDVWYGMNMLVGGGAVLLAVGLWLWWRERGPWAPIVMAVVLVAGLLGLLMLPR